jgi:hypothetical protein
LCYTCVSPLSWRKQLIAEGQAMTMEQAIDYAFEQADGDAEKPA